MNTSKLSIVLMTILSVLAAISTYWFMCLTALQADLVSGISYAIDSFFDISKVADITFSLNSLLVAFVVFLIVWGIYFQAVSAKAERTGEEAGSARWLTKEEIKKQGDSKDFANNILLTKDANLRINWDKVKGKIRGKYELNKNVLVIGGSGSGKTRYYVTPNIMQANTNLVITDPKGTLIGDVGGFLVSQGYTIKSYNTIQFEKSNKYNPFQYLKTDADILVFAEALIANTTGEGAQSGEEFWVNAERLFYIAILGCLRDWYPTDFNFNGLLKMTAMAAAKEEDENYVSPLDYVFREIETGLRYLKVEEQERPWENKTAERMTRVRPQSNFGWVPTEMKSNTTGLCPGTLRDDGTRGLNEEEDFGLANYKAFKAAAGKTLKSILISVNVRLKPFGVTELRKLLDETEDEMELDTLGDADKKIAVFCIMSDTQKTFNPIHAIMQWQSINILCDKALTEYGGKLPRTVHFMLDEFANIGKFPNMERVIAVTRSRNIALSIILQNLHQLDMNYDEVKSKVMTGNCDTWLYLGKSEYDTDKQISERLGQQTIRQANWSQSRGSNGQTTKSINTIGRSLADPSEVGIISADTPIVLFKGKYGYKNEKLALEDHPNYKLLKAYEGFDFQEYRSFQELSKVEFRGW